MQKLAIISTMLAGLVTANNHTANGTGTTGTLMTTTANVTAPVYGSDLVYQTIKFTTSATVANLNQASYKSAFLTSLSAKTNDADATAATFAADSRRLEASAEPRFLSVNSIKVDITWTLVSGTTKSTFQNAVGNTITTSNFEAVLTQAASTCNACALSGVSMNITVGTIGAGSASNPATSASSSSTTTTSSDAFKLGLASVFVILAARYL